MGFLGPIALIIASGSCQGPRLIVLKMASLELCQAATNLATRAAVRRRIACRWRLPVPSAIVDK